MLPNFFIAGPPKCASSSLFYYLAQHPEIFMYENKDTRFFSSDYGKGIQFYKDQYFKDAEGFKAIGESTPVYSFLPFVAERIAKHIPDAKFIFSLRNPVERAFSGWFMLHGKGTEKSDFHDAIIKNFEQQKELNFNNLEFSKQWEKSQEKGKNKMIIRTYLEAGNYMDQINNYLKYFPKKNIKLVFMEDIKRDIDGVLKDIFQFLAVDESFQVTDQRIVNASGKMRFLKLFKLFGLDNISKATKILPDELQSKLKRTLRKEIAKPVLPAKTKDWLIDFYTPSVKKLGEYTNRNLSHWLK